MRFWDSSALVPLLVTEASTPALRESLEDDPALVVWWGTVVECISALARHEREGALGASAMHEAVARLDVLATAWEEVEPSEAVRRTAVRLLRTHSLRAADALQLAAARVASEEHPESLTLVTLDDRLLEAARREGFPVQIPAT